MKRVKFCKCCNSVLILDKEHHTIVRDEVEKGMALVIKISMEPKYYDAFECNVCGSQNIIGERKREVYDICFEEPEEDTSEDEKSDSERISDSEDGIWCNPDDIADIRKKIDEAGE